MRQEIAGAGPADRHDLIHVLRGRAGARIRSQGEGCGHFYKCDGGVEELRRNLGDSGKVASLPFFLRM